jgi:hypothetical protein
MIKNIFTNIELSSILLLKSINIELERCFSLICCGGEYLILILSNGRMDCTGIVHPGKNFSIIDTITEQIGEYSGSSSTPETFDESIQHE